MQTCVGQQRAYRNFKCNAGPQKAGCEKVKSAPSNAAIVGLLKDWGSELDTKKTDLGDQARNALS